MKNIIKFLMVIISFMTNIYGETVEAGPCVPYAYGLFKRPENASAICKDACRNRNLIYKDSNHCLDGNLQCDCELITR